MNDPDQLNGISYWEKKFCVHCKEQLCRKTAQAKASVMIGQGPAKDYVSCMKGFEMAILLGDRDIIKRFRKGGNPPIDIKGEK